MAARLSLTHLQINGHKNEDKRLCYIQAAAAKSLQLCLTLCDPTDGSPSGSPVPGILQARTLEWVAISLSKSYLLTSINEEIEAQRD